MIGVHMKKILIIVLVLLIISCGAYYYLTNHTDIKLDNVVTAISSDIISIPIQEDRIEATQSLLLQVLPITSCQKCCGFIQLFQIVTNG